MNIFIIYWKLIRKKNKVISYLVCRSQIWSTRFCEYCTISENNRAKVLRLIFKKIKQKWVRLKMKYLHLLWFFVKVDRLPMVADVLVAAWEVILFRKKMQVVYTLFFKKRSFSWYDLQNTKRFLLTISNEIVFVIPSKMSLSSNRIFFLRK